MGRTALHCAVDAVYVGATALLLDAGASADCKDPGTCTSWVGERRGRWVETEDALLKHGEGDGWRLGTHS